MQNDQPKEEFFAEVIDLRDIIDVLKKRRKIIALITLISLLTSGILSFFVLDPVYEAKGMLLVTMASDNTHTVVSNNDNLNSVIDNLSRMPQMTMNTYVEQLKSEAVMKRVITKLKLGEYGVTPSDLSSMIDAQAVKDTNIIEIKVQNTNPQLAMDIANTLNSEFLDYLSEKNQEQMSRSAAFLTQQKEQNDKKLNAALAKLKEFNAQPRGVDFLDKEFTIMTDDLNSSLSQLDSVRIEVKELQAGITQLTETLKNVPRTITVNSQDLQNGSTAVNEQVNPLYVSLNDQLNQKQAALAEKTARLDALVTNTERLKKDLTSLQVELSEKKFKQTQLQNEIDRLSQTSTSLADKATQTQIAKSIDLGNTSVVIVSSASTTRQVKPNKQLNMAVALVLGLMLAVGLAFMLEFLDNTLKSTEDIEKILEVPVIGVVPNVKR
ncbi:GumC family protein [Desulfotruncus alcoholivorax]|uniref:GumC family protein n=1 Tax=Desulfotruncus alcoholivorax TaxID=265477 RepID=UPI00041640DD|nr:Wzz/FepE/Etk N-terminal domain-containing protein [Desulfotruncus alcoholivorax]